ncbi:MAG: SpoIIE family protein phosphatase [Actinobacteria bacterium]|nr:SpoIIE family protein phosphatase [Actinomycetota bacterium]
MYATAYPGQRRSGDAFLIEATAAGALVAVVDALGHGDEAADVADRALASLRQTVGQPLPDCLAACHRALCGSRGAVMTLIAVDPRASELAWMAVGNIEAAVVARGRAGANGRRSVPQRGGVVGERLPAVRESCVPLAGGDTLLVATDGLAPAFVDGADLSLPPPSLARLLHAGHARDDDDALVLVARPDHPR